MKNDEKYELILKMLREAKPQMKNPDALVEEIQKQIQNIRDKERGSVTILDYLFGWAYVGWIRKGLLAASVILIVLFAWQQSLILRRINSLEKQAVITNVQMVPETFADISEEVMIKLLGMKTEVPLSMTEKQLTRFIKSYNELQEKYSDLIKFIEDDPVLKEYLDKKLSERNKRKFNL